MREGSLKKQVRANTPTFPSPLRAGGPEPAGPESRCPVLTCPKEQLEWEVSQGWRWRVKGGTERNSQGAARSVPPQRTWGLWLAGSGKEGGFPGLE